jgi:hypothetical protein
LSADSSTVEHCLPAEKRWAFPNLTPANYECTSDETSDYNCIAWAYGVTDDSYWPDNPPRYWPAGIRNERSIEAFVELFASIGYELCADTSLEAGFEKIAIYAVGLEPNLSPRHAARQLSTGKWSSKLGDWEDIEHHAPEDVESPDYGRVVRIMGRPHAASHEGEGAPATTKGH